MDFKVIIVFLISCFVGALCQELCVDSCPVNEIFSECKAGPTCQKTCSTRNTTVVECACVSGCICKPGYFRDANTYICIKKESCPPIPKPKSTICAKNEVYSECEATSCQKNCYTINDNWFKCGCIAGCICADGYIRSPITNQCILIKSCDKCPIGYHRDLKTKRCELNCDICLDFNAEFKACGDRCKELTCENPLLEGIVCPELEKCEPGCYCKAGYVKDPKTKKCIRPNSCPNPCKDINAEYSNCGTNSTCDMQTCRFPQGQGDACMKVCQKGCFCKPGYVKNDAGKCVLPKNCPIPTCKKNEIYDCRNPTCEPGCLIKPCISVNCENKCYCKDGYVKENGTCILLETCKKCDDPNSTYSNCKSECSVATCLNPSGIDPLCKGELCGTGCFCKKGYVKDHTGKCILLDKCPKCPYNESFSCGSAACEKNCGNLNETCIIQNIKCDNKCFCNKDFVRETPDGPCIPISKCPPNKCKINEVFECRNPSCDDEGCCIEKGRCKDVPCESKCYCADGFVRIDGACVPRDNCFKDVCSANEIMDCRNPTCDDEGCCIEKGRPCKDVPCENKCYCADGFVRIDGACVPRDNCFKDVCPINEVMDCRNPTCLNEGCLISKRPCLDVPCEKRCYCADGFARIDGTCVSREKCKEICKDPNSSFNSCGTSCEPTCDKPNPMMCPKMCVTGCFCNDGYIKDSSGICILIKNCPIPSCKDPNSEYSCANPYCEPTCSTLGQDCQVENAKCVNKCYCKKGYALSDSGVCIPESQCKRICPANEIFECRNPKCNKESCTMKECLFMDVPCKYNCYCEPGLVRIDEESCVSRKICLTVEPTECEDPNATYDSCGSACAPLYCGKLKTTQKCPNNCVDGCFCNAGYIKANATGDCIPIEKCPKECPANEIFSCSSAACEKNCKNLKENCTIVNKKCDDKCFCIDGYVREFGPNGPCIPIKTCPIVGWPPIECKDPNESYRGCPSNCEPTCDDPNVLFCDAPEVCPIICWCNDGYIRENATGACIPIDKCTKTCPETCPVNESCSCKKADCEPTCEFRSFPCVSQEPYCSNGCYCKAGFIRYYDGGPCLKKCPHTPHPTDYEEMTTPFTPY